MTDNKVKGLFRELKETNAFKPDSHFQNRLESRILRLYSLEHQKAQEVVYVESTFAHAFLLASIVLFFLATGVFNSLPGDVLYPVKLASERVVISLADDEAAWHMQKAQLARREEEILVVSQKENKGKEEGLSVMEEQYEEARKTRPDKANELITPAHVREEIKNVSKKPVTKLNSPRFNIKMRLKDAQNTLKRGGEEKR